MVKDMALISIEMEADETRFIEYPRPYSLDIQNLTDDVLFISYGDAFNVSDGIAEYLQLDAGTGYNGLKLRDGQNGIYLKSKQAGIVNIAARS